MQDWFNDIGAYGNVTGPNAYRGQTMNLYTGGSLYMRTPVRNYQLASIAPPSFTAGCGGIDLFAGSFSFINKEQFVACCAISATTPSVRPSTWPCARCRRTFATC
jgi:conjugative transfer pilus assembly protein TraH